MILSIFNTYIPINTPFICILLSKSRSVWLTKKKNDNFNNSFFSYALSVEPQQLPLREHTYNPLWGKLDAFVLSFLFLLIVRAVFAVIGYVRKRPDLRGHRRRLFLREVWNTSPNKGHPATPAVSRFAV